MNPTTPESDPHMGYAPQAMPSATVQVELTHELAHKLQAGVITRIFKAYFTADEHDALLVALSHALRGEDL